jgi:hypothetical protein
MLKPLFGRITPLSMLAGTFMFLAICSQLASAQSPPFQPGTLSSLASQGACPSGMGWAQGETCYTATVTCPNTQVSSIQLELGIKIPSANPAGVIVILSGGGGTSPTYGAGADAQFANAYYTNNYTVVQTQWGTSSGNDWEIANNTGTDLNILQAACRPAAVLNFVRYNTNYSVVPQLYFTGKGMCAHGFSAGSAAIGYSLAFYGAANYLDKAELLSGPVLSDIAQGCVVPQEGNINICGGSQSYCQGWPSTGLSESPNYVMGTETYIWAWTGDTSCRGTQNTTQASYNNWLAQSIVNGPNGGSGSFNYPNTSMQGWLCSSDTDGTYNESGPEGWLFYSQVGGQSQPPQNFEVFAVGGCQGVEGVPQGNVSSTSTKYANDQGLTAIVYDMSDPNNSKTQVCQNLH